MEYCFTIPGRPIGKQRPKVTVRGNFPHAYTPEKTTNYENFVKLIYEREVLLRGGSPLTGAILVQIDVNLDVPCSFSRKKKAAAVRHELFPTVKPDADNIAKTICDALNGIAYTDDKQIVSLAVNKFYTDGAPFTAVRIQEVV